MMRLDLQGDEASALEALLDKILTSESASKAAFPDGEERRSVKRVSMKLHWAKLQRVGA
jgi:hypothetical protein